MTRLKRINKMNLLEADIGVEYIIESIGTGDREVDTLLFSLGCYREEPITIVSKTLGGYIVAVKDGRYFFDKLLVSKIKVCK